MKSYKRVTKIILQSSPRPQIIGAWLCFFLTATASVEAQIHTKMSVVTSTSTLRSLVEILGGERVKVESIAKGSQDPHYVEAKPSYMIRIRDAKLLVSVGLDLEVGWLSNVVQGARNPQLMLGNPGYFEAGALIQAIEVPVGQLDRSQGDVHPGGNPHFYLDPERMLIVARELSIRLSQLDPEGKSVYEKNFQDYEAKTQSKMSDWKKRIQSSQVKEVITHHRTLSYFLDRFSLKFLGTVEAKPGIPPTAKHILAIIDLVKKHSVPCILVESFFELKPAQRVRESTGVQVFQVPTEVDSMPEAKDYFSLIEELVQAVEACADPKSGSNKKAPSS